jgi:hypothetical protein
MAKNKLTDKDLSISTKASKAVRGRVKDIPKEESKIFMEVVYDVLGSEGISEMKKVTYWFKHDILEKNYRAIIKALEEHPKGKDLVDKVLVNKKAYFTDVIVFGRKFYRPLTWEQKFIVLTEMYKIYNWNGEELDTPENKKYRDAEVFVKVLDEGKISDWYVSVTGYCDTTVNLLENKVSISDVLFWLQNDWRNLSGDYWIKKNSNTLSRGTNVFENRHYQAFNEIFKKVFGRDLKCIGNFTDNNVEGILGRIKLGLEEGEK